MIINHPFVLGGGIVSVALLLFVVIMSRRDLSSAEQRDSFAGVLFGLLMLWQSRSSFSSTTWREDLGHAFWLGVYGWIFGAITLGWLLDQATITDTECIPSLVLAGASGVDTVFIYEDADERIEMVKADVEGEEPLLREALVIRGNDTTMWDYDHGNVVVLAESIKILEKDGTLRSIPRIEIDYRPYSTPPYYRYGSYMHSGSSCSAIYGDPADAAEALGFTDRT